MGQIITFYSYKGGVGRTMALANIAVLLARVGRKVLIVDWDLDAPGLEYYFKDYLDVNDVAESPGVINLLNAYNEGTSALEWQECVTKFKILQKELHLISSGRTKTGPDEDTYFSLVRKLDVNKFYEERRGGGFIEKLRDEWKTEYDFILIDSRTGITDIGGICTIQLPDILVLLATANQQSLGGIVEVAKKVNAERKNLPFDRFSLITLPILSRFDGQAEFEISQKWLNEFALNLGDNFSNWLPKQIDIQDFIEATKIPYVPYFSYGEKLPVLEQGLSDPAGLGFAYGTITLIIVDNFDNIDKLLYSRGLLDSEPKRDTTSDRLRKQNQADKVVRVPTFSLGPTSSSSYASRYSTSQEGVFSLIALLISSLSLGISFAGSGWLVISILVEGMSHQSDIIPKILVIGLSYIVGWVVSSLGIRVLGNLVLQFFVKTYAWIYLTGICLLQISIISRLFKQAYSFPKLIVYVLMMAVGLLFLVGLHLILDNHNLVPFSFPILFISLAHVYLIAFHYIFVPSPKVKYEYLWGDLIFFFMTTVVAALMMAHFGILNGIRKRIDIVFQKINRWIILKI